MTDFSPTDRSKLTRLPKRGSYDRQAVFDVLDAAMTCHIAYVIDGQPFCTPTTFWRHEDVLYWHGAFMGRMGKHLSQGAPVCVTVSHLDGLVMARSAFHHSVNFRSAMCFGTARPVSDMAEKTRALTGLIERFYPGRTEVLRPMQEPEVKGTLVVAMPIEEASAKCRADTVGDDAPDYALPIWAGVIPVQTVLGAAQPCPRLSPEISRPAHLDHLAEGARLDQAFLTAMRP